MKPWDMGIERRQMVINTTATFATNVDNSIYVIVAVRHFWFTKVKCTQGLKVFINPLTPWLPQLLLNNHFFPWKEERTMKKNRKIFTDSTYNIHNKTIVQSN